MATKLEVGGKALVARPLVEEIFFFAASLSFYEHYVDRWVSEWAIEWVSESISQ